MAKGDLISIEVAYALPTKQVILTIDVPEGTTLHDGIKLSGILEQFPEVDLTEQKVGIFGNLQPADRELVAGDRIEIYRPLTADPKQVRRERAERKKAEAEAAKAASAQQSPDPGQKKPN